MYPLKLTTFLIVCMLQVTSCQQRPKGPYSDPAELPLRYTGSQAHFNEKNVITSSQDYKDGILHGYSSEYYSNGNIYKQMPYYNGKNEGIYKEYFRTGELFIEVPLKNGRMDGLMKKYHKNGKPMAEIPYRNGMEGIGLREYEMTGKESGGYPEMVFEKRKIAGDKYEISVSLTKGWDKVEYYAGELADGKYMNKSLTKLMKDGEKGIFHLQIPKGAISGSTPVNVIARIQTPRHNPLILQKEFVFVK